MAHTKAGGSTALGRDSHGQRLGVKLSDGSTAKAGAIIVRQRGTKIRPGANVGRGNDDTLFALAAGIVKFKKTMKMKYTGRKEQITIASVHPVLTQITNKATS